MKPEDARALMAQANAADAAVSAESGGSTDPRDPGAGAGAGELPLELQSPEEQKAARLAVLEEENRSLLQMALGVMTPMLPFLPSLYTPEVITNIAKAGAAVEHKHGFSLGDLFGKYKEEAVLAIVVLPVTVQTVVTTRLYIAEQKKAAALELEKNKNTTAAAASSSDGTKQATG